MKKPGSRSKLTVQQWQEAKAMYEAGATFAKLSTIYGLSVPSLWRHAERYGWKQKGVAAVKRRVLKKVHTRAVREGKAGSKIIPLVMKDAFAAEIQAKADIITEHRANWRELDALWAQSIKLAVEARVRLEEHDAENAEDTAERRKQRQNKWIEFEEAKRKADLFATLANALGVKQKAEREANGIDLTIRKEDIEGKADEEGRKAELIDQVLDITRLAVASIEGKKE